MNRENFMRRLEIALRGMPEEERRRAMEYYENYFDEAGAENERGALEALGEPERVAEDILREFREVGAARGFRAMDAGQKLLAVVLVCAALFVALPACVVLIGGAGGVLIGLIAVAAFVVLLVPALSLAAWLSAIACAAGLIYAAAQMEPADSLLLLGLTLAFAALGLLLWELTVYLFRRVFPALFRGLVHALRGLLGRLRGDNGGAT